MIKSLALLVYFHWFFVACSFGLPHADSFFEQRFENKKEGCFLMVDQKTGKTTYEFNKKRCMRRFPPCSTFKIALSAMAFDSQYFKKIDQKIKWDGKKRTRESVNQDQTPLTFMKYSVIWVSQKIVGYLGQESVQSYVNKFGFGNKHVSGDLKTFWLSSGSIKVSAKEQTRFLSQLWKGELELSKQAVEKVKQVALVDKSADRSLFGKTGTGCIDRGCMSKPGRQLGWFVGVLKHKTNRYTFALNYSDLVPTTGYAGPKAKQTVIQFFNKYYP